MQTLTLSIVATYDIGKDEGLVLICKDVATGLTYWVEPYPQEEIQADIDNGEPITLESQD